MSSLRVDLRGRRHRTSGLTLLEVLICLVIVSTAFVGLVNLENQDIRALSRSRKMTTAVMLARNMMAQIELAGFPEELGEEEGDFQEEEDEEEKTPSAGFRWKRSIEAATLGGRTFDHARRVKVTIIWEEGPRERHFDAVMYLTRRDKM
jgi:type II secretion system protein I